MPTTNKLGRPDRTIDIWYFDCDDSRWPIQELALCLPPGFEHAIEPVRDPVNARRRLVSQAALRILLSSRLCGATPATLKFDYGYYGKPSLNGSGSRLYFNLSHSHNVTAIAIAANGPIGIDVEHLLPTNDDLNAAVLVPNELRAIASTVQDIKLEAFYRCWVRKEAILKAHGAGLALPTHSRSPMIDIEVSIQPAAMSKPLALPELLGNPDRWTLLDFSPGKQVIGSVAAFRSEAELVAHAGIEAVLTLVR